MKDQQSDAVAMIMFTPTSKPESFRTEDVSAVFSFDG